MAEPLVHGHSPVDDHAAWAESLTDVDLAGALDAIGELTPPQRAATLTEASRRLRSTVQAPADIPAPVADNRQVVEHGDCDCAHRPWGSDHRTSRRRPPRVSPWRGAGGHRGTCEPREWGLGVRRVRWLRG